MFVMDMPVSLFVHFTDGTSSRFHVKDVQAIKPHYLKMIYINGNQGVLNMNNVQWVSACKEERNEH